MRRYRFGETVNTKFGRGMITCRMGSEFVIVGLERGAYHTTEAELDAMQSRRKRVVTGKQTGRDREPTIRFTSEISQRPRGERGRPEKAFEYQPGVFVIPPGADDVWTDRSKESAQESKESMYRQLERESNIRVAENILRCKAEKEGIP